MWRTCERRLVERSDPVHRLLDDRHKPNAGQETDPAEATIDH
jgi:hypothetical protein